MVDKKLRKKAISAIIVLLFLILVSVGLITIILNWSNVFTSKHLSKINSFTETKDFDGYIHSNIIGDNVIIKNNSLKSDLSIQGYKIMYEDESQSYETSVSFFESSKNIKPNQTTNISLNCVPSNSFKLQLYTTNNKYLTIPINGAKNSNLSKCRLTKEDCAPGYVFIPGNSDYGTSSGFCVMQFEAKVDHDNDGKGEEDCSFNSGWGSAGDPKRNGYSPNFSNYCEIDNVNNKLVSSSEGYPLVDVSLYDAKKYCKQLGSNYYLINNEEWMTIARNLEQVSENWVSGSVGTGYLKQGNNGSNTISSYDFSSDLDEILDYGLVEDRNELAKLVLDNGEEIWDFSGNVGEWVDFVFIEPLTGNTCDYIYYTDSDGATMESPKPKSSSCYTNTHDFKDIIDPGVIGFDGLGPSDSSWDSYNGIGRITLALGFANSGHTTLAFLDTNTSYNSSRHALIRGSFWNSKYDAGIYALNTNFDPSYKNPSTTIGFRCVYNPYRS